MPDDGDQPEFDPAERPVLVYDDDCGFCTYWTVYVARRADVDVVGFSELTPELREFLPPNYERGAHLITPEGVYSWGAAMEEAFVRTRDEAAARQVVEFLREFEEYERLREGVYSWVSDNRGLLGRLTSAEPPARVERDW